jgi:hypothetical protein
MAQQTEPSTPESEPKEKPEEISLEQLAELASKLTPEQKAQGLTIERWEYRGEPTWQKGDPELTAESLAAKCKAIDRKLDTKMPTAAQLDAAGD